MINFLQKHRPKIFLLGFLIGLLGFFIDTDYYIIANSLLSVSLILLYFE